MKKDFLKIGFSGAASWAWGTSLIMGQQIAQQKGLLAFFVWAICNSLTLALFGFLYNKKLIKPEIYKKKEVKVIALIIQLFCLLVQLNFINQQFFKIFGNPIISYLITTVIGFIFTLIVFKKGLPTSIKTDITQWLLAIGTIVVIIGIGFIGNVPHQTFMPTTMSGILWGIWSGLILFAGPIGDVQHWQRAEADSSKKGYYLGAGLFAMYMMLILGMALFKFNMVMNIILLATVLCVTTSTIDSIAVALHELGNKKIGTTISLLMCIGWGLFVKMGMIELWSAFGVIRFAFAVAILTLPLCYKKNFKIALPALIGALGIMIIFTAMGQYAITNIFGLICFSIAVVILGYNLVNLFKKGRIKYEAKNYKAN